MGTEDIPVGEQWDTVRTAKELKELKRHVIDFMSHTSQTMMREHRHPFGGVLTDEQGNVLYEHPMSPLLSVIEDCESGVLLQYGKEMMNQAVLFDQHFEGEEHG